MIGTRSSEQSIWKSLLARDQVGGQKPKKYIASKMLQSLMQKLENKSPR